MLDVNCGVDPNLPLSGDDGIAYRKAKSCIFRHREALHRVVHMHHFIKSKEDEVQRAKGGIGIHARVEWYRAHRNVRQCPWLRIAPRHAGAVFVILIS
jgi:hypothetical protein